MARSRAEDEGQDMGNPPAEDPPEGDKDKVIKELRAEVERLTQALEEANQKLQEQEAAAKRVERTAQAEKLLDAWEKAGRKFAGDTDRTKELDRLVGLSDEAFAATSEAIAQFVGQPGHTQSAGGADEGSAQEDGKSTPPAGKPQGAIAADAGVHPAASPDNKSSLQDKLTQGFMAAYEDRVGGSA